MVASRRDLLLFFFDHPIYPKRKIIAKIENFISIQGIYLCLERFFLYLQPGFISLNARASAQKADE
jgi:hypothetical protein